MKVMLRKVWNEIRERRKLMEEYEVDHINEYNKLNSDKQKPYILLAIDEVAMLQDEKRMYDDNRKNIGSWSGTRRIPHAIHAKTRCKGVRW